MGFKEQKKEGGSTVLGVFGPYDVKQKQGEILLRYPAFHNVRRGQDPEAAIPGHSHCDPQGCPRAAKQEACVEKG